MTLNTKADDEFRGTGERVSVTRDSASNPIGVHKA